MTPASPYAMVQIATEAYNGLYHLGWIITDRYEAGWVHMEPPFWRQSNTCACPNRNTSSDGCCNNCGKWV